MDLKELAHKELATTTRHPWEYARLRVVEDLIKNKTQNNLHQAAVLDIGCGDTFVVEALANKYPNTHFKAIDIAFSDEQLTAFAEKFKDSNISVYRNVDDALAQADKEIALILLLDVIEHIEDEIGFLNKVNQHPKITNNTEYLITVPAYQWLFSTHDVFMDHYRRYTNTTLKQRLAKANIGISKSGYFFTTLLVPRVLRYLIEKTSNSTPDKTTGLVAWTGGKFITGAITTLLYTDYCITSFFQFIGIKIPGLSNYAVCRKSVS